MKIYIIGPMRGIPYYNFPAFDAAAKMLRAEGHEIISPAEMDRRVGFDGMAFPLGADTTVIPEGFDLEACVDRDLAAVRACDAVHALDGWERSKGARAEHAIAAFRMKDIFYQSVPSVTARPPLPDGSAERKTYPLFRGLFCYFPRALAAVAHHSWENNKKHNPGEPLHWSKEKSNDHPDCILRHMLDAVTEDDLAPAYVAVAWRSLAQLEILLEERACPVPPQE